MTPYFKTLLEQTNNNNNNNNNNKLNRKLIILILYARNTPLNILLKKAEKIFQVNYDIHTCLKLKI